MQECQQEVTKNGSGGGGGGDLPSVSILFNLYYTLG